MTEMKRLELNIPRKQDDKLEELVKKGLYSSKQEAIRVAIARVYLAEGMR